MAGDGRKRDATDPRPLPLRPAFKTAFLDFERGIRMGGLEPNERITQIVRAALERRHGGRFVIDKWGRGRFWRWIAWTVRENRDAKPLSAGISFASAKLFLSLFPGDERVKAGLQIERAALWTEKGPRPADEVYAAADWDFYRFVKGLRKGSPLAKELDRLVRVEGFIVSVGAFSNRTEFRGSKGAPPGGVKRAAKAIPPDAWGGVQAYYPLARKEVTSMTSDEIVEAVLAIFDEVAPLANRVMVEAYLKERTGR